MKLIVCVWCYFVKKKTKYYVKVVEPSWVFYQHSWNLKLELFYLVHASGLFIITTIAPHILHQIVHLHWTISSFLHVRLADSSVWENKKPMNKNHLLESLLKAQVPSSTISQKAFTGHNVSPLLRPLLKAHVPPSAPNPGTEVPALTPTHKASPLLPASLQ